MCSQLYPVFLYREQSSLNRYKLARDVDIGYRIVVIQFWSILGTNSLRLG